MRCEMLGRCQSVGLTEAPTGYFALIMMPDNLNIVGRVPIHQAFIADALSQAGGGAKRVGGVWRAVDCGWGTRQCDID